MSDPTRTSVERLDPMIGCVLAERYRVELKIGSGGFGAIFRGYDLETGIDVAIKVLHPALTADPAVVARFRREGAALSALRSPNTVAAFALGETDDGALYIVMELLEGQSLYMRYHERGPQPWRFVVEIARAVCDSLAEAHALGIIHRDLKPANIFIMDDPEYVRIKVLDFGIAKIIRSGSLEEADLTHVGQMVGTFDYMAPEQMVGGACSAPTDLFTLGIVMYETIAGRLPFGEHATASGMLAAHLTPDREPIGGHVDVPEALDRIVLRCLAPYPADRFASAVELAGELDRLLEDYPDPSRTDAGDSATVRTHAVPDPAVTGERTVIEPAGKKFIPTTTLPGVAPPTKPRR
jgi:eukaryotic-like serine/threonine-protein kinase